LKELLLIAILLPALRVFSQKADTTAWRNIVHEWSDAHNMQDFDMLGKLYAGTILLYSQEMSFEEALKQKKKTFAKFESQEIISGIKLTRYESGIIRCDFRKKVVYSDGTKEYPAYLLLKPYNEHYFISGESDVITDAVNNYQLNLGKKVPLNGGKPAEEPDPVKTLLVAGLVLFALLAGIGVYRRLRRRSSERG
jgi:hypothetical protein